MELEEAVRPCWMEIDLGALADNVEVLRSRLGPDRHIIAALKGDAYGHGIGPVARCLARADVHSLATGSLRDAVAIRDAGVELPILMFAGPLPEGMAPLLERGLTPTVHDWTSAQAISEAATHAARGPAPVYVKVDSGLGRLGVPVADALDFVRKVRALDHVSVEGVYTHLTFQDAGGREWARERYAAFDALLEALEKVEITGEGVGMVRSIHTIVGIVLEEKLESIDHDARILELSIVGDLPAGMQGYHATGRVCEDGDDSCILIWEGHYKIPGADAEPGARDFLEGAYGTMFSGLRNFVTKEA